MLCTEASQRLHAQDVLDHCWMENNQTNLEQLIEHRVQSYEEWDVGGNSFSATFMSRNQDISFGVGSPACDTQSPTFTCLVSGAFSFRSAGDSTGLEFSSSIPSMLSFSFLSSSPVVEQKSCKLDCSANTSNVSGIAGEAGLGMLPSLPDSTLYSGIFVKEMDHKLVETKRAGVKNGSGIGNPQQENPDKRTW